MTVHLHLKLSSRMAFVPYIFMTRCLIEIKHDLPLHLRKGEHRGRSLFYAIQKHIIMSSRDWDLNLGPSWCMERIYVLHHSPYITSEKNTLIVLTEI
jgi:hypothetical protein